MREERREIVRIIVVTVVIIMCGVRDVEFASVDVWGEEFVPFRLRVQDS